MTKVTLSTLRAIEALGLDGQLVAGGFYKSIFNQCANRKDWKGPIKACFRDAAYELDVIRHAVIHFTGNPDCKVYIPNPNDPFPQIVVESAGYRAGPAGDR